MSEAVIVSVIGSITGLIGGIIGAAIGAYATIRAAEIEHTSSDSPEHDAKHEVTDGKKAKDSCEESEEDGTKKVELSIIQRIKKHLFHPYTLIATIVFVVALYTIIQNAIYYGTAKFHRDLGDEYYSQGLYDDALREFAEAKKAEPQKAINYNKLGNTYTEIGQYDDAKREHSNAVVLDKGNAQYHGDLGMTLYLQGDYKRALIEYQKAEELSATVTIREEFKERINEIMMSLEQN